MMRLLATGVVDGSVTTVVGPTVVMFVVGGVVPVVAGSVLKPLQPNKPIIKIKAVIKNNVLFIVPP
jgi:hypothetical protein